MFLSIIDVVLIALVVLICFLWLLASVHPDRAQAKAALDRAESDVVFWRNNSEGWRLLYEEKQSPTSTGKRTKKGKRA